MAVYSVFEPPERGGDATEHAGEFVFVRDGFSFPAFLFGPLWMLWHRLWLVVIGYIIAVALLEIAIRLAGGGAGRHDQRTSQLLPRRPVAICIRRT
jgi:Protein of unknown function (DUF2628)